MCRDVILGLPAQKELDMIIRPKAKTISLNGAEIPCTTEDRRVSCFLLDGDKMEKVMNKASKSKKQTSDFFVVSLQVAEQIASVDTDFGSEYDDEIKSLIEEFEDITHDFKGFTGTLCRIPVVEPFV